MAHTCHAENCTASVPPAIFMCKKHWYMVPKDLREGVWREYRRGQEITKTPTNGYLLVARAAIAAVAAREAEYDKKREGSRRAEHGDQVAFDFDREG